MATLKKVFIPITDEGTTDDTCTGSYLVRYKLGGEEFKQLVPNPLSSPIVITGLIPGQQYGVEIRRSCCDGQVSEPTTLTITVPD